MVNCKFSTFGGGQWNSAETNCLGLVPEHREMDGRALAGGDSWGDRK